MKRRSIATALAAATAITGLAAIPAEAAPSNNSIGFESTLSIDYDPGRSSGEVSFRFTPLGEEISGDIFANRNSINASVHRKSGEDSTSSSSTSTSSSATSSTSRKTTATTVTKKNTPTRKTVTVTVTPEAPPTSSTREILPPEWEGYVDATITGNLGVDVGVDLGSLDLGSEASEAAKKAVKFAYEQLGTPYVWGGTAMSTPGAGNGGLDCSGLTQGVYAKAGVSIPRTTWQQVNVGTSVTLDAIQPGDLVFYNNGGHVAIYVGNNTVIHAPQTGDIVKESSVSMMTVEKIIRVA